MACSTVCPCASNTRIVLWSPWSISGLTLSPDQGASAKATRRRAIDVLMLWVKEPAVTSMPYGSPGSRPWHTSRASAQSRTDLVTTKLTDSPTRGSALKGICDIRPREGFRPTRPQCAAGLRIEPPASVAVAMGTARAATIAHDPPLDPPGVRSRSQGFRVIPAIRLSVTVAMPNSGVVVLPSTTAPCRLRRPGRQSV